MYKDKRFRESFNKERKFHYYREYVDKRYTDYYTYDELGDFSSRVWRSACNNDLTDIVKKLKFRIEGDPEGYSYWIRDYSGLKVEENNNWYCQRLMADYIDNNVYTDYYKERKVGRSLFYPEDLDSHMLSFLERLWHDDEDPRDCFAGEVDLYIDTQMAFYDLDVCLGVLNLKSPYRTSLYLYSLSGIDYDDFLPKVSESKYRWTKPKHFDNMKEFYRNWIWAGGDEIYFPRFYEKFGLSLDTIGTCVAHVYMDKSNSMVWSVHYSYRDDFGLPDPAVRVVDGSDDFLYGMSSDLLGVLDSLGKPIKEVYIIKGYEVPFRGDFVARKCRNGEYIITMY